jgi:HSP20 family protein
MKQDSRPDLARLESQLAELLRLLAAAQVPAPAGFAPPVDLFELPDRYLARVDVPGMSPEDLELAVAEDGFVVHGRRPCRPAPEAISRCHRIERAFGPVAVEIPLPGPVKPHEASAQLRAGVLEITLPRRRDAERSTVVPITEEEP